MSINQGEILMCFSGDYDVPEMMIERVVRGRKGHTCYECRSPITKGEEHQVVSGKWEGSFAAFRTCRRCCYDRIRVVEREIDEGCDRFEAWPPFGILVDHLQGTGMGQTDPSDVPASFRCDDQPKASTA